MMKHVHTFIRFFITGGAGAVLSLSLIWVLTTFVFGLANYFTAYLCGVAFNVCFTFFFYTRTVFKTKGNHARRLGIFAVYTAFLTFLQAQTVHFITPRVGLEWYLVVIGCVAVFYACVSFVVFRWFLFKEEPSDTLPS